MTTTSQQPPTGDRPSGRRGGRSPVPLILGGIVALIAVATLVWLFVAGPMSSAARTEREVEEVVRGIGASESLAEFNDHLCEEQRMPQTMIDSLADSGAQTGVDLDAMFREQVMGKFPENIEVTGVEVDGENAVATLESSGENAIEGPEELRLREEGGSWKVCEPGVGMGAVPEQQPGG